MQTAAVAIPAKRDRDLYGRRVDYEGAAPHRTGEGYRIAYATWTRTEDGWDCDYDFPSYETFATEAECWAAIKGTQDVAVAA